MVYLFEEFFVLIFISSTAGWSKGLILSNFPTTIVSIIKKENNSPITSSFIFLILISLNDIPFLLKDFINEFF